MKGTETGLEGVLRLDNALLDRGPKLRIFCVLLHGSLLTRKFVRKIMLICAY